VSEVKPGSTNVNICVETSGKFFNQHGDAIITNTIKSSHGHFEETFGTNFNTMPSFS
jgi:hypothetical protein